MEITVYEDILSEDGTLYIDRYIAYFMENLQEKFKLDDGSIVLEGQLAAYYFNQNLPKDLLKSESFLRWIDDEKLDKLHKEITAKGMKLDPLNFYTLCLYILELIKEQYFILLKPTIADTLEELSDVKTITFENADGKTVSTSNKELIKLVMDNIKSEGNEDYEVERFVKLDDLGSLIDKTLKQASFTYNVALFLSEYFKDYPRRANCCMVSAKEQELILYMLYFFGLSPVPLTDSRYRQLISYYKKHITRVQYSTFPNIGMIPVQFLKYKDWKNGIDLNKIKFPLNEGDTVHFTQK